MTTAPVSSRAWIELLHAEVCWHLERGGVDVLVVKGPTLATWLYPDEERQSADVDVLVRPAHWTTAVQILTSLGFSDVLTGFGPDEQPEHAAALARTDPDLGRHAVDLHRHFPGIDREPESAFAHLWERRQPGAVAGVTVQCPDEPTRALLALLHLARDPRPVKTRQDVTRAWATLTDEQRADLGRLARELDAGPALLAGITAADDLPGAAVVLGLDDLAFDPQWTLLSADPTGTAVHVYRLRRLPWWRRPAATWRLAFPSRALIRSRDPRAAGGTSQLVLAYLRRMTWGVRSLPSAVRDVRALPPPRR